MLFLFLLGYVAPITSFINVDIRRDRKLVCVVCDTRIGDPMQYHGVGLLTRSVILYVEPESLTSICLSDGVHKHVYAITMCENTHLLQADPNYSYPIYNIRHGDGSVVRPICPNVLRFVPSSLDSLLSGSRMDNSTQTEELRSSLNFADPNLPSTSTGICGRLTTTGVIDLSQKSPIKPKKDVPSTSRAKIHKSCLLPIKEEQMSDPVLTMSSSNPLYQLALSDNQAIVFRETREISPLIPNFTQALYLFVFLRLRRFIERPAESETYFDGILHYCFAAILNGDFPLLTTLLEM